MTTLVLLLHLCSIPKATAQDYARIIDRESNSFAVPVMVIAAVIKRESSCKAASVSKSGDFGLMQVRRGAVTTGKVKYTDSQLLNPRINIRLGVKRLRRAMLICGGEPVNWLSNYAGLPCGQSVYSRRILATMAELYNSEASGNMPLPPEPETRVIR